MSDELRPPILSLYLIFWTLFIPFTNFGSLRHGYNISIFSIPFYIWITLGSAFSAYQLFKLGFNYDLRFDSETPLDKKGVTFIIEKKINSIFKPKYYINLQLLKFKFVAVQIISMGALAVFQLGKILFAGLEETCDPLGRSNIGCGETSMLAIFWILIFLFGSILFNLYKLYDLFGIQRK
jgi:hypothetical protein